MPAEDVTIALIGLPIEGVLQVGDYVDYDTSSLLDIVASKLLTGSGSDITVSPSAYTGDWRVLSNDGSTVTIIATANVAPGVKIIGETGGRNISSVCSSINNSYLNSDYASTAANPTNTTLLKSLEFETPLAYTGNKNVAYSGTISLLLTDGSYKQAWFTSDGTSGNMYTLSYAFRPVITLKSSVYISGGSGTSSSPYTLSLE